MKLVTQERILKALDNLYRTTHENTVMRQTEAFALHGLKSVLGEVREIDNDKLSLELQLIEEETPVGVQDFSIKLDRLMDLVGKRRSKILDIQVEHGVSGLEWLNVNGNAFPFFNSMLRPLAIDVLKLAEFKESVVQHWIDYSVGASLTPYRDIDDEWRSTAFNEIWEQSQEFEWANIWLSEYYLSPHSLKTNGHDTQRNKPTLSDDRLHIEFNLILGRGVDWQNIDSGTLWFCSATKNTL